MGDAVERAGRSRTSRGRWAAAGIAAGLAVAAAGVFPTTGAASGATGITYTSKTVVISAAVVKSQLLSTSANGATYTFKSRTGALAKLKKGSVMLLTDLAVRDVTSATVSKGHLVIGSRPAAITDLISSGSISLASTIDFAKGFAVGGSAVPTRVSPGASGLAAVAGRLGMQPLSATSGITLKGTANSYKYSVGFKSVGKAVDVTVTISKDSPVEVEASIKGTLENLKTAGNISVNHGKLTSAKLLANSLSGKFTLAYSAKPISQFGLGTAGGVKVTLPAEIAVPFFVGPIPFFLGVKVAIFASAGFSNFNQQLSGSYTLSYDGAGGISTSSAGAVSPSGVLKGLGSILLNAKNAVNKGPLSFVFGAQMPDLELGLGVKGLNVAGNLALGGSSGIATFGPGCDTRQFEVFGSAGVTAHFFGLSSTVGSATLFDKTVQAAYPKGCGRFPSSAH